MAGKGEEFSAIRADERSNPFEGFYSPYDGQSQTFNLRHGAVSAFKYLETGLAEF
jgi:hypothetical protein